MVRQNHLRCWSSPEDVGKRMPIDTIDLTEVRVSRLYCKELIVCDVISVHFL